MARPKSTPTVASLNDITKDLLSVLNKAGNGSAAYLQGEHSEHSCGITIPHLAFQWLVGGIDVLPVQRFIGISGMPKSFKSTLNIEFGNWTLMQNGIHVAIDNEGKTSASMLDAMSRITPELLERTVNHRPFKGTESIEEWQNVVTTMIKFARSTADRPKGQRVPIYVSIDSLNGKTSKANQEKIAQEGNAETRGFPVDAMMISKFLKGISLIGTTLNVGYIQHLMQDLSAPPGYNGPVFKESGAAMVSYQGSLQLRVVKGKALPSRAFHPSAPAEGPPIEGYTLWITTERSCLGPDKRCIPVDILWQYVEQKDGPNQQVMWYDWDSSLAWLLNDIQTNPKGWTEYEREKMRETLKFNFPKTTQVNCAELKLEGATLTEFGKAIRLNPDISARLSKMLNIVHMPNIQEADMELGVSPGDEE